MCRLYGFRATRPTRMECDLLEAQNSLIHQSREDERGLENPDGWGLGLHTEDGIVCARQMEPASESPEFRKRVMQALGTTGVAHVRRATVGGRAHENTHPFRAPGSLLAHNGHLSAFEEIRPRMLAEMGGRGREAVLGDTDSEHFFQLLLSRRAASPGTPPHRILRDTIREVVDWIREAGGEETALNVLWTVDGELVGSRLGRTLWYLERDAPVSCAICDMPHAEVPEGESYRSAVLASERISPEGWEEVPEGTVFRVDGDARLRFELI